MAHNKKYHSDIRDIYIYITNTSTTMVFTTEKTVLLRLQYHDYFYHSSSIFIPHFMIK